MVLLGGVALPFDASADPGTPGVPQAPVAIYADNFQNRPGPTPIVKLNAYTSTSGQTYSADPAWLTNCNGWIASANQSTTSAAQVTECGNQGVWNQTQRLSWALGLHAGQSQAAAQGNYAVSAFTAGNPGAGLVEFRTATNIPFPTSNRFLSFSVDVAAVNCNVSAPLLQFSLVDDGGVATPAGSQINACASGATQSVPALGVAPAGAVNTGTYTSNGAVLISGSSFGVRMVNNNGSGTGNDHAFDNVSILDATPQLDKEFGPTSVAVGGVSTLTFTITNTSELGAKTGWSFTDALPVGLRVASDEISTTCPSGVVTAPVGGSTIDVSGNLTAGMASCTATIPVTSSSAGTYTNDASNITSAVGVNPPGSTSVTFGTQPNFVCDSTMYFGIDVPTRLHRADTSTNPFTFPGIGAVYSPGYNAMGYDVSSNYIYATRFDSATSRYRLLRIGSNGSVSDQGPIVGGGINGDTGVASGVVGPDGYYYLKSNSATNVIYRVDLTTRTATSIPLNRTILSADLAWRNGLIYTHDLSSDIFYSINPNTGAVTPIGPSGLSATAGFGSLISASNGIFGRYNNGGFYQFDLATGVATLISDAPAGVGDGAKCPVTAVSLPADTQITKTDGSETYAPGTSITYTMVVSNNGPFGVQNASVNDPLPAGITGASWTCGGATNGGVCGTASGTGAINDVKVNLPAGSSVTFQLTLTVPADFAGDLVNAATVANSSAVPDPDTSNNSATDTDVAAAPALTVEKTGTLNDLDGDGLIDAGETISYSFVVENTGNVTLTDVTVDDPLLTNAGVSVSPGPQTLAPGGMVTFTATYQPTQADIDAGQVENTATGTGTPPSGPPIDSPPDTVVVPPDQTPGLTIEKTGTLNDADGDGLIDLGETISYSFLARNTGTVTLTNVTVDDPLLANAGISVTPGPQTLGPGGTATFTATYTPTQADIDAGQVENTATGTGTPPSGPPIDSPPDTVVVPPDETPGLTIDKTGTLNDADGDGLIDAGETISYSFLVRNTGSVTLTGVTVDDPLLAGAGISVTPGPQTLAPGGTATFTATYTPTQADIDAGQVENTATGTGTPPSGPPIESPPDTVVVPPDQSTGLVIDKTGTLNDLDGDGLIDLGETISYSFQARNTGAVTLTNVTVNDPLLTDAGIALDQGPQTLAPGATFTFTATYTPNQADIDAGQVENTATGTGTPPSGPPIESPPDTVVVPPDQTPGLTIDKTGTLNDADGDGLIDLGETISYSFLVRNTGAVTMTNVTVNDPLLANAGISVTPGPQTLAPGGTATFTATYTPTQADIDAGQVENTATGTGTPPSGPPIDSPPDTVVVPPDQTPGLTINKTGTLNDADGDGLIDLGETISYSFLVRNTGTVTMTGVTVDDPLLTNAGVSVSPGPQTLAPGGTATFTATYTPTQVDIDAGQVENTATGTGTPPSGPPIDSPPDTVVVPPDQTPGLTIEKTGRLNDADGDGLIDLGETISYSFLVRNTGTVTLTNVTVDDPLLTNAGISVAPGPQTLAPRGSVTFTATYTPTQADIDAGRVENTATGTGTPPSGPPIESPPDTVVVPPDQTPGLTIEKTGTLNDADGDGLLDAGETISYSFLVRNTGAVTVTNVTVNDPLLANAGISVTPGPQTVAPGGTVTFTATYTPTQAEIDAGQVENTATGTGTPPSGPPTESPPDTVVVPPDQTPALTIEKTGTLNDVDGDGFIDLGETISYSFLVTNSGAVTMTNVTVNDPLLTDAGILVTPGPQTLAPGGTATFTATYTPTQADIDAGRVENTATGTGTPPSGPPIDSPPDTVVVPPDPASNLVIEKTGTLNDADGDGLLDAGETISYSFLVRNTGAVTVTNVTVNDPLLANAGISVTPGPQTLAPGGTATFTATYTPTQADIDAGRVENTATGTGTPPSGPPIESPPDTVVVPPEQTQGLTIEKTGTLNDADGDSLLDAGETINYSFLVRNTGVVTLTNVTVDDPLLANAGISVTPGPQTLAPGGSVTFTATYTPTQADIDAGRVENTATGTGTPPSGPPTESPPDTVVVPPQPASLKLQKTGRFTDTDRNSYTSAGDTVTYTFTVTNDGGQTITNVWPVDAGPTFNGRPAGASLSRFTPEPATLAPGESQDFTAVYTLTQGDVENAAGIPDGIANSATASGRTPDGEVSSDNSTSVVTPPAAVPGDISVTKVANLRFIRRGEKAPFTIRVTNNSGARVDDLTVIDTMPAGFRYVEGSAIVDGAKVTPEVVGRQIRFREVSVGSKSTVEIQIRLLALSTAGPGEHVNLAHVVDPSGGQVGNEARAVVEIIVEPVFDCGDIIGKVFDDTNRNGYQDEGEPGLPGVRIATVKGWLITTDLYGRFHVACADLPEARIGSNFIMKLDPRTLPTGYRLTTENPRVVRLTAGKMTELNFGASIGRVVRLDLKGEAFVSGKAELDKRWADGIDQLITVLAQEQSVLRLSYIDAATDPELAEARVRHIKELVADRWRQRKRVYPLNIETRVEAGQ
ncbi:DUF7507 domain-containing protein [Neorhizobium petrolearium]|uniref:DUF7507 domain-containing protein n=1 Tax=Neorhizobium petrolearium TaxID=515361 RepID=UPI003F81E60A